MPLSVSEMLGSANLEVLVPQKEIFPRGAQQWFHWARRWHWTWLLWTSLARESTGKEEGYSTAWGDCLDFQRGGWGSLLVFPFLWLKSRAKLLQPNTGRSVKGPDQEQRSPHQGGSMKWEVEEYLSIPAKTISCRSEDETFLLISM